MGLSNLSEDGSQIETERLVMRRAAKGELSRESVIAMEQCFGLYQLRPNGSTRTPFIWTMSCIKERMSEL